MEEAVFMIMNREAFTKDDKLEIKYKGCRHKIAQMIQEEQGEVEVYV